VSALIIKGCCKTITLDLAILTLLLLLFSAGCQRLEEEITPIIIDQQQFLQTQAADPTGAASIIGAASPANAASPADAASSAGAATQLPPTNAPLSTQTPIPTATLKPIMTVYGPSNWSAAIEGSIASLNAGHSNYHWKIAEEEGLADLIISTDSGDFSAGRRPLVLTVPYSTDWDQLTIDEANEIILNGHPLIEVQYIFELSPNTRAIKIDGVGPFDVNYPLRQSWSVIPKKGFEEAAEEWSHILSQTPNSDPFVHLVAVGDIMLDRSLGDVILRGNVGYPFELVIEELTAADLTVGNLESSLGDIGEPANKSYTFQAPPEAAKSLENAGFDLLSLANNHALDYGQDALIQGINLLQREGIDVVGAGADLVKASSPVFFESKGVKVAFLAYVDVPVEGSGFDTRIWTAEPSSPGLNWTDPANITHDVADAKDNSDIVIVLLHSGYEYVEQPSPEQSAAAKVAIDAGADLIVGHHAHVLQGLEFYKDGVIVYGLGNFAFDIDSDPNTGILNVWLDKDGVRQIDLVPAVIQPGGQPRLATPSEASDIKDKVNYLTDLLNGG
jgi:poly-gamma-glutamate synthesis protein (capsule biosynthesis protein)